MEKSVKKFLSVILCMALLFSFPVAVNAQQSRYEETFTGTYTAPESAVNVLVSGATVSEWYGDRVNMGGHTYSVRQNECGLNKDGNMLKMEIGETYTLWLAQYGVASLSFTAAEEGYYAFKTEKASYGHSPQWVRIEAIFDEPDALNPCSQYTVKDYGSGNYYDEITDEGMNQDAFVCLYLEKDETVYIAASADEERDSVYNLKAEKWTPETCAHKWIDDDENAITANCVRRYRQYCAYCDKEQIAKEDRHDNTVTTYTSLGNDRYHSICVCEDCGKTLEERDRQHHYVRRTTQEGCAEYVQWICEGCGYIIDEEETKNHQWEWKDRKEGCSVVAEYTCKLCGLVNRSDSYENHPISSVIWSEDTTHDCHTIYEGTCTDCGKVFSRSYSASSYHEEEISEKCWDYYFTVCDGCGEILWEYKTVNDNHRLTTQQTVNEEGLYTRMICQDCGYIDSESWDSVWWEDDEGHRWHHGEETYASFKEGVACRVWTHPYICIDCGKREEETGITHEGESEYVQKTPQHDNICGTYNYICTECGEEIYKEDLTCHANVEERIIDSCMKKITCLRCGENSTEFHHATYRDSDIKTKAATCTQAGYTYYVCRDCHAEVKLKDIPATGQHQFALVSSVPATCTATGTNTYACTICQASYTEPIAQLAHTVVIDAAVAPTTKTAGKTEGQHCAVCGLVLVEQKPVPKKSVAQTALPKVSKVKSGKKSFKVTWKKVAGVSGYQVQYSTHKKFKKGKKTKTVTVKKQKTTKVTLKKNIASKKVYYIRIRSYKTVKGKKQYSEWSKVKKVKTK